MIETEVFQKGFVGRDGFIWWIGQIANDSWTINAPGSSATGIDLQDQHGFDYRYQVRIMGYHTADNLALPDSQLPWATLMYPVTAGGGARNFATPAIKQGNFVYGFFMDGEDAQQPVIMGILGYNQYNEVMNGVAPVPFMPFMGFTNPLMNTQPTYSLSKASQNKETVLGGVANIGGQGSATDRVITGAAGEATSQTMAEEQEYTYGRRKKPLDSVCDKSATGIQKTIQNLIQDLERVQNNLVEFSGDLTEFQGQVIETQQYIQIQLQRAAKKITGWLKDKIKAIMNWIVKKITDATDPILNLIQQDKKSDVKAGIEKALELLVCAFKRIISKLFDMVIRALQEAVLRWINVPLCAAENILASIIGKLMGLINGIVNMISGVINGVLGLIGQAVDIIGDLVGFLDALLSIFELCKPEKAECPRVTDWSLLDGSDSMDNPFDVESLIDKIKGFASGVSDVVGEADIDNFDFDLDFSDVFDISGCDTGPKFCGPPEVIFWGGSGNGALGNAIIGALGDVIGVDIVNSGTGYATDPPYLRFKDDCDRGKGTVGTAVTGPVYPVDLKPYRAKRRSINKVPPDSPDDWELLTIPSQGLPLWDPAVVYYGERTRSVPSIDYVSVNENSNLKNLYENPVESRDGNFITAEESGYENAGVVGVTTYHDVIIPADIVAYSSRWVPVGVSTSIPGDVDVSPEDTFTEIGVVGVDIQETGYGYIGVSDGSMGGDERTWATPEQTVYRGPDGRWSPPYRPGDLVPVMSGGEIYTPPGSVGEINCMSGGKQEILGGSFQLVTCDGVITAPSAPLEPLPPKIENTYPVILNVCGARIINPGFGYQEGDKVIITPDNGAEITPQFGNYGNLISLKIVSSGEGFQQMPTAYIESATGINAEISLRLCIDRVGDDITREPGIGDKMISVVDCVGKV